jgi:hypothetical protein
VLADRLMPLHTDAERRWAYYVPQPIPDDAVAQAPESVRDIKILDPAVGSGHFLVVALDLLVALYREEARHRGIREGEAGDEQWSDRAIVERILEHNLHGIDLDPRAVQIAAAALWLKARQVAPEAQPERINLVASNLRLASLPDNDPALVELRREVERETGIPARSPTRWCTRCAGPIIWAACSRLMARWTRRCAGTRPRWGGQCPSRAGCSRALQPSANARPLTATRPAPPCSTSSRAS